MTPDSVTLRALTADRLPTLVRWRSRPDVAAWCFSQSTPTVESFARRIEAAGHTRRDWLIEANGLPVGAVNLDAIDTGHRRAETGILIGEAEGRRKGIATEAMRQLLALAFGPLELARVYLHVFTENAPALALYHRLGFRHEGTLKAHALKDGRWLDVHVMGLLKAEWPLRCFGPSLWMMGHDGTPHYGNGVTGAIRDVTCPKCKAIIADEGGIY